MKLFLFLMLLDEDECASDVSVCGPSALCENVNGAYECFCHAGFYYEHLIKSCNGSFFLSLSFSRFTNLLRGRPGSFAFAKFLLLPHVNEVNS